ncbi:hypothetical protein [Acinetobacter junii]|uniref:hypothetical protein n=1 Tax=Acinetobacter junii TaxID=40215 RepID=UPI0012505150|nr:hypothetical protein [Acinetobacter junii]
MNAIKFIQQHGVDKAREVVEGATEWAFGYDYIDDDYFNGADIQDGYSIDQCEGCVCVDDLKRLVKGVDLINSVGGLTIAKKITFQKRLRNEKATHFIQHPENQKLIQLFVRNQSKPEAAIKFDLFEQAIADYEAIYES